MSFISLSPMNNSPPEMSSSPAIILSRVDLPQPEGPTNTTNSCGLMSRSTPLMTSAARWVFRTPCSFKPLLCLLRCQMQGLGAQTVAGDGDFNGPSPGGLDPEPG